MKNIKRLIVLATLIFMVAQVASANNDIKTTKAKTSKVYVVLKSGNVTKQFMDNYGAEFKKELSNIGIESEYAILSGKFSNAIYKIALDKGAEHILFINQTKQINIDRTTNVGGFYEVKSFGLKSDFTWKNIDQNIRMNVQFDKSVKTANTRIIESFLNKI